MTTIRLVLALATEEGWPVYPNFRKSLKVQILF